MAYEKLALPELILFTPKVIKDEYGINFDSRSMLEFSDAVGLNYSFVQDNHSKSIKGVLRGLHYQLPTHAQDKLVQVVQGAVFDVAVYIRKSSSNFGKWLGAILSEDNKQHLWITPGFAHGFVTLTDTAEFCTKLPSFMIHSPNAVLLGMNQALGWIGTMPEHRSCQPKTCKVRL